jgi:hypothetical protein
MSDIIAAAFLAIVVAWIAHKWSSGDLKLGSPTVKDDRAEGDRRDDKSESKNPKTFGVWASQALSEFADIEKDVLEGGSTQEGLRKLYAARGSIMENFYARKRYAPNDDKILSDMDREADEADFYMTSVINKTRSRNKSLRFVRYPLSCGDGDSLFPVEA